MPHVPFTTRFGASADPLADDVLLRLRFDSTAVAGADPRDVVVPLDTLGPVHDEIWRARGPVTHGWSDGFGYAHDGEVVVGHLHLPTAEVQDMERATRRAYVRIEILLRKLGYAYWLRMWNYIADIRDGQGDAERYRQFALGRYHALEHKPGFEAHLPAATAIGSHGGGFLVFFLASKTPGEQIENPRQVSAFRYPREYGPRSPSFSRATLKHWDDGAQLFVSGTASIVGHESQHVGDPLEQLAEVHRNVEVLRAQASLRSGGRVFAPQTLKLYLQQTDAATAVLAQARALFGADAPLVCVAGEICRNDLLLEVEGIYATGAP